VYSPSPSKQIKKAATGERRRGGAPHGRTLQTTRATTTRLSLVDESGKLDVRRQLKNRSVPAVASPAGPSIPPVVLCPEQTWESDWLAAVTKARTEEHQCLLQKDVITSTVSSNEFNEENSKLVDIWDRIVEGNAVAGISLVEDENPGITALLAHWEDDASWLRHPSELLLNDPWHPSYQPLLWISDDKAAGVCEANVSPYAISANARRVGDGGVWRCNYCGGSKCGK